MAEEQEGDGGEAVDRGSVGGVNAEGSVVVLVGDHFGLKGNQIDPRTCLFIYRREGGDDLILSVNTLFNIYSQVPTQPSFMLLIMKNNKGFDK